MAVIDASRLESPIVVPDGFPNLNRQAMESLAMVLSSGITSANATGCALILLHRTLHASFGDDEFMVRPALGIAKEDRVV